MDQETKQQLRAADSGDKVAARMRRYRQRRKAENVVPRNAPRNANPSTEGESASTTKNVTGPVICGHCHRLFSDIQTASGHVPACPVRDQQTAPIKKNGECCFDPGEAWHATPCMCFCHYPSAPAWTMTRGGHGLPLHKHRDTEGRCHECGAEAR